MKPGETRLKTAYLQHVLTLLGLLGIAFMARIRITVLDFNSLLTNYLADDAFYYYKIASNIFNLHRITYDGEQLSNGFHPLWLVLITPFYTPANDGIDFVYRVQWLMLCCNLLTVVALYLTFLRLRTGWWCAVIVTTVFCVHSTFVDMQINGLETSLNTLVLLLLFNAFLTIFLDPLSRSGRYIYFGVVAAAAFLARTDNGITLLVLFLALAWVSRRSVMPCWPRLLLGGATTLLLVFPWLLWNWTNFGSLVQGSGKVETIYWGQPSFSWVNMAYSFLVTPQRVYNNMEIFSGIFVSPLGNKDLVTSLFMAGWAVALLLFLASRRTIPSLRALAVFCMAVLAVFSYHAGFRSFVRMWYHLPLGLIFLLSVAGLALWFRQKQFPAPAEHTISALLLMWLASVLWLYSPAKLSGTATERSSHLVVADWINTNLEPDAIVGSMNSGVLGYLVHRKVINLDGVVDTRSMRAHWEKRQPAYIHERKIHYLVDNDGALAFFCNANPLHTCQQVFSFGDQRYPSKVVRIVDK